MQSHKDLTVWQKSMDLVELVYKITGKLPKSEVFGLSSQMQRAAVAIPFNIIGNSANTYRKTLPRCKNPDSKNKASFRRNSQNAVRFNINFKEMI